MPSWNEIEDEIVKCKEQNPQDYTRLKYLKKLNSITERNVIAYYSGFLQYQGIMGTSIDIIDKNAFMNAIYQLDKSKGLDLILHTPGGSVAATESIVHYLREIFGTNIRVIIPQIAMSAGTMIACSASEIIMGKHSNIGPIDPQFNGLSAEAVIDEFNRAIQEISTNPNSLPIWQTVISKYHPTFVGECENAINWSKEVVTEWLESNMFMGEQESSKKATDIVEYLSAHKKTKAHNRHIHYDKARELGLKITLLEEGCQEIRDAILSIHHAFMYSFKSTTSLKIIESHQGKRMVINGTSC